MIDPTSLRRTLVLTTALAACAAPTASGRVADAPVRRGVVSAPSAAAVARDHSAPATPTAIAFINPLGRSRGPGAGAGLL
jgi:hypothetical protein